MFCKYKILCFFIVIGLLLQFGSCIEPISLQLNENDSESMLVVAGQITDKEGPFRVKLTTSIPVNTMQPPDPVLNAIVRIYDDKGNEYQLNGNNFGWYETTEKYLKGVPGNRYTLSIITPDGKQYESSSVLMEEMADVDSVYFEEVKRTRFEGGEAFEDNWMNILIDTHDSEGKIKYWLFEFEETWEVRLLTAYVMVEHSAPGSPSNITRENVNVSPEKEVCWVTKPSKSINVATTVNNQVNELKRFPVQTIGPGDEKLHIKYSILIRQSSINRDLYNFWNQLMDANENAGDIYDKMPAQVYGNITCCNGTAKALGYFSASSIREKRLFINKSEHHLETVSAYKGCIYYDFEQLPWIPKSYFGIINETGAKVYCSADFCADCRAYGTNVKPDFWR